MATNNKNELGRITPRAENYSDWYQDVIREGKLAEVAGVVKGCMVIKPHGYAIWEKIQRDLDDRFKATGHQNAYFPLLIPLSFLAKEAKHVEGFAMECAVVTHSGLQAKDGQIHVRNELEEPYVVRPTSETIIGHFFSQWIQSWRDLPMLINQWANVMRWELRTRMFLRTSEFLWQEGHTAHATHDEAMEEVLRMLQVYRDFAWDVMAMPVIMGKKTESERFAGAVETFCIEGLMQDGKALQAGTSHDLGQNFGKAFDVKFQNKEGREEHVWQTSWGVSTRLVGGLVMTHSDDAGLVLPPALAPLQAVIVPFFRKQAEENQRVLEKGRALAAELRAAGVSVKFDEREGQPGSKFYEYERMGVPLRFGIGPKDLEAGVAEFKRRDQADKRSVPLGDLAGFARAELAAMQKGLLDTALARREAATVRVDTWKDFTDVMAVEPGKLVYAHWDGTAETEARIKAETGATIRCIPLDGQGFEAEPGVCVASGKPSARRVLMAKAY
jgi:prolyl-tRNA synthetase